MDMTLCNYIDLYSECIYKDFSMLFYYSVFVLRLQKNRNTIKHANIFINPFSNTGYYLLKITMFFILIYLIIYHLIK